MSATASTATQLKPLEWLNRLRANPRIPLIVAGGAGAPLHPPDPGSRCRRYHRGDGPVGQNT